MKNIHPKKLIENLYKKAQNSTPPPEQQTKPTLPSTKGNAGSMAQQLRDVLIQMELRRQGKRKPQQTAYQSLPKAQGEYNQIMEMWRQLYGQGQGQG